MNIKRAKQEIKNTVEAYLKKDEDGNYLIPKIRQRPIILIGPPGIGKTAVIMQAARECGIGFVSYNMTHHTRQSALGLPYITDKEYDGRKYSVTEYTMSEIIASVYDKMKSTGLKNGILFIDEINCVSETLAPVMLQFLQAKAFGSAKVPDGWVIVAAGNPQEYNNSVHDFDVVTLDRVKLINAEADYKVWKEYALKNMVHPAIISYLDAKQQNFCSIKNTVDGMLFATPRGWEDMSDFIKAYEKLGHSIDSDVIIQYIQDPDIAGDFANYLELYYKYEKAYDILNVLMGNVSDVVKTRIKNAAFDERISVVNLMLARLNQDFLEYFRCDADTTHIFNILKRFQASGNDSVSGVDFFEQLLKEDEKQYKYKKEAGLLDYEQEKEYYRVNHVLNEWLIDIKGPGISSHDEVFEVLRSKFTALTNKREQIINDISNKLEHSFEFEEEMFGTGPEMLLFVTELASGFYSLNFIQENGCDKFFEYNKSMLRDTNRKQLEEDIDELMS